MLQNLLVAVAFVLASAWVAWALVLPRAVKAPIRKALGLAPSPPAGGSCGGCCGGCGSEGEKTSKR